MFSDTKLASIFILFGLAVLSGISACLAVSCLARTGSSTFFQRAVGVLNSFSGGVFLATSILHLLPESRESLEDVLTELGSDLKYPFTELLMGIGFMLILILEHAAHACCSSDHACALQRNQSNSSVTYNRLTDETVTPGKGADIRVDGSFEDSSWREDLTYQTYGTVDGSVDNTVAYPYRDVATPKDLKPSDIKFDESERIVIRSPTKQDQNHLSSRASGATTTQDALKDLPSSADDGSVSTLRGIVLLLALSLHMVFDGLALGLLDKSSKVWELLLALSLHKILVFFTIALQALEILKNWKKTMFLVCLLALISPLGIAIGESLSADEGDLTRSTLSAILQGLATGTFLYVTFFEMLLKELDSKDHDIVKVLAVLLGFAVIAGTRFIENEE